MKVKHLILLVATSLMVSACDLGNFESVLVTPHYSIFYSEDFARRFSLPIEKSVKLNNTHFKAVAITIQKIDGNYECSVNVYYDNNIKLNSPDNRAVFFRKTRDEWFFVKKINKFDSRNNEKNVLRNSGKIFYRTKNIGPDVDGVYSSARYSIYKENILPNLNMASVSVGCGYLVSRYGDAEIWVQKAGVVNYELINEDPLDIKHKENNYRFDVPLALLQTVKPMIDRINALPVDPASSNISVQYGAKE